MKPNQSNNNDQPATVSVPSPQDNPCLGSDPNIAALEVIADDGISYLFPYAQFLSAERVHNPALEKVPDAPPEKMRIHFATAEVTVLGSGLNAVERRLQKYELALVKSADRRLAATLKTHIAAITVTLTKENI
jgi:hypothetical protein